MELFKGLTQEEFKELRSIIILIGIVFRLKSRPWKEYITESVQPSISDKLNKPISSLLTKTDNEIELIFQGVLNE